MKKILCVIGGLLLLGCVGRQKSGRELFMQYVDKNIEVCAENLLKNNDIDSLTAIEYSKCMIYALYNIDSNFVLLPPDSMSKFVIRNIPLLKTKCGLLPNDTLKKH